MKLIKLVLLRRNISYWLLVSHNYLYMLDYFFSLHIFGFLGDSNLCHKDQM